MYLPKLIRAPRKNAPFVYSSHKTCLRSCDSLRDPHFTKRRHFVHLRAVLQSLSRRPRGTYCSPSPGGRGGTVIRDALLRVGLHSCVDCRSSMRIFQQFRLKVYRTLKRRRVLARYFWLWKLRVQVYSLLAKLSIIISLFRKWVRVRSSARSQRQCMVCA